MRRERVDTMPTRRHLLLVPRIVAALGAALVSGIPSAPTVAARATPGVAAPGPPNVFFYNLDDLRDAVSTHWPTCRS
ncbi:hypothetical protein BH24ACT15_BH24ACT15_30560 [soil metagenome]